MAKIIFEPVFIKLSNYIGYFTEWDYQKAIGNRYFFWVGYSGLTFDPFDVKKDKKMSFEMFVAMNDGEVALQKEIENFNRAYMTGVEAAENFVFNNTPLPKSLIEKYKL